MIDKIFICEVYKIFFDFFVNIEGEYFPFEENLGKIEEFNKDSIILSEKLNKGKFFCILF